MTHSNNSAQTLENYVDQLYFGMLSFSPDHSIIEFLTKYVPVALKRFDTHGEWTAYPPGVIKLPQFTKVINAYVFEKHPYFDAPFKSGQLAITQQICSDERWGDQITDIKLWFEFDSEVDATEAFKQLLDFFTKFNTLKRFTS